MISFVQCIGGMRNRLLEFLVRIWDPAPCSVHTPDLQRVHRGPTCAQSTRHSAHTHTHTKTQAVSCAGLQKKKKKKLISNDKIGLREGFPSHPCRGVIFFF